MSMMQSTPCLIYRVLLLLPVLALLACASENQSSYSGNKSKTSEVFAIAQKANWIIETVNPSTTNGFELLSARKSSFNKTEVLTIYIEGDGHAWEKSYPSLDPTQLDPIALRLALEQTEGAAAYLARPCQYIGVKTNVQCTSKVWTDQRFTPKAIDVLQGGINYLKQASGARQIVLIGYSGGGTLALLAATQRSDGIKIITVAGNLDTQAWLNYHHLPPMPDALNPADYISKTQSIPQFHFVGGRDEVTPPSIAYQYANQFSATMRPRVIEKPDYGHVCCWVEGWRALLPMTNQP